MRFSISFLDSFLEILFPSLCLKCGKGVDSGEVLCAQCFGEIPLNKSLFCGRCGARLPYGQKICHPDFPYILGAATSYKNEMARELVRELKFKFIGNAARPLAKLLISYIESTGFAENDWIVVPIPLGAKRLRQRGFNQASLIAGIFAVHFSLPLEKDGFIRRKETKPQSELENFELRAENAKDCFEAISPEKFSGKKIILVDDVSTSGATFFEAASSLKKAGARKVMALAAAKG